MLPIFKGAEKCYTPIAWLKLKCPEFVNAPPPPPTVDAISVCISSVSDLCYDETKKMITKQVPQKVV